MTPPLIDVAHLFFDYPGHRALNDVSLRIEAGSVTALVGPNGAGKTTLLRCMAALETPVAGRIFFDGHDVHEEPRAAHRQMGYLSDSFGLYGNLSVARCLRYAACAQGVEDASLASSIDWVAERLGLREKLTHTASTLSRGQRQRVAIAQAIIHRPRLLLLDEPASGLDPEARSSLAHIFRDLQKEGMTLLVSSHILAELDEYSTHMLALDEGRILEHRALQRQSSEMPTAFASPLADSVRALRFEFIGDLSAARNWLAEQPQVALEESDPASGQNGVNVRFSGSQSAQADLIAECIAAQQRVLSVAPVSENLQHSYLKSLQAKRSAFTKESI